MQHAFGSAGTQAAGLWEFLSDAADSKQLHAAKAAATDSLRRIWLNAALLAQTNSRGSPGHGCGHVSDADPAKLTDRLGEWWALSRPRSSGTRGAATRIRPPMPCFSPFSRITSIRANRRVTAHVHQAAIDVLGAVDDPATVHQAKFSMGTVLAMIAVHRRAGLTEFDRHFRDPDVVALRERIRMVQDAEVERAYPGRWIGKVEVVTTDGQTLAARVDEPRGDPGNTLSRDELIDKAVRLAQWGGAATEGEVRALASRVFTLAVAPDVGLLLPARSEARADTTKVQA